MIVTLVACASMELLSTNSRMALAGFNWDSAMIRDCIPVVADAEFARWSERSREFSFLRHHIKTH